MSNLKVKVHCPFTKSEENVFFHPFKEDGNWFVSQKSFNGCEVYYHTCPECDSCEEIAWELLFTDE